jgi:hypothetical protein
MIEVQHKRSFLDEPAKMNAYAGAIECNRQPSRGEVPERIDALEAQIGKLENIVVTLSEKLRSVMAPESSSSPANQTARPPAMSYIGGRVASATESLDNIARMLVMMTELVQL